jgi:hypothetical protein
MQRIGFGVSAAAQAECEALLHKPLRGYLDYAREVALKLDERIEDLPSMKAIISA